MCRFACVLVWLGILAYLAILATEFIAEMGGASYATSGVVFLALGSQLPDFIAAVNLASHGETTDGLAQAGGSQVLNMSLGLGFPVLIYSLVTDSGIKTDNTDDILDLGLLCAAMVVVYLVVVLVLARSPQTSPGGEEDQGTRRRVVTKTHAVVLVGVCATLYTLSVLVSEYRVYFLT